MATANGQEEPLLSDVVALLLPREEDGSSSSTSSATSLPLLPSVLKLQKMLQPPTIADADQVPEGYEEGTDQWLKSTKKKGDLYDVCSSILSDLEKMAGPRPTRTERNQVKREGGGKIRQLEESRRKKREQVESRMAAAAVAEAADKSADNNQMDEDDHDDDENDDADNDDSMEIDMEEEEIDYANLTPTQRTIITIQSTRVALELMKPLVQHPRCRSPAPVLPTHGKQDKRGRPGKKRAYLLSPYVYGYTSAKQFDKFCGQLERYEEQLASIDQFLASSPTSGGSPSTGIQNLHTDGVIEETLGWCLGDDFMVKRGRQLDSAILSHFRTDPNLDRAQQKAIKRLQRKLEDAIRYRIKDAELTIYGSCLSGLSLGKNSDVDVSIHLPGALVLKEDFEAGRISAKGYEQEMKRIVFRVKGMLDHHRSRSYVDLIAVPRARLPVIKGRDLHADSPYSKDGSMHFDICFLNDIAVANSSLLGEYSKIDRRVRELMLTVKSFVKSRKIGSAAESTYSSYTWMVLTIFYLQCIGFVPNLQGRELMNAVGFVPDPQNNPAHLVNGLDTAFLSAEEVFSSGQWQMNSRVKDLSVSHLFCGFLVFYARVFPHDIGAVSIRRGRCDLQKTAFVRSSRFWRTCIEDPFETYRSHFPHDLGIHADERGQTLIANALSSALDTIGHCFQTQFDNAVSKKLISSLVLSSPSATNDLLLQMGVAVKEDEKQDDAEEMSENEAEEEPTAKREEKKKKSNPRGRGRGKKGGEKGQSDKNQVPEKNKASGGGTGGNAQGQGQKKANDGNKNRKNLRPHYRRGNRNKGGKAGGERKQDAGTNQS